MRARAFWALVNRPTAPASKYIQQALRSSDPNLRIIGIRASKQLGEGLIESVRLLLKDADVQVRRECALALHNNNSPEAPELWASLAAQHERRGHRGHRGPEPAAAILSREQGRGHYDSGRVLPAHSQGAGREQRPDAEGAVPHAPSHLRSRLQAVLQRRARDG